MAAVRVSSSARREGVVGDGGDGRWAVAWVGCERRGRARDARLW